VKRRDFLFIVGLAGGIAARPATAQSKGARAIGILYLGTESDAAAVTAALRQGLIERGYTEARDFQFDIRFANNDASQLRALARTLVRQGVAVIVTNGTTAVRAALAETERIPIILAGSADPVEQGYADALARPGRNVTGLTVHGTELLAKRLELLRDAVPGAKSVGALLHGANPGVAIFRRALERSAAPLGLELHVIEVRRPGEIETAFARFAALGAQALFVIEDPVFVSTTDLMVRLSIKHRLPILTGIRSLVHAGGFVFYGFDRLELWQRSADFVDRIFRGAAPADIPIEQPTKFTLIVNLKTAKTLDIVIPQSVLVRADEIIE
jgi:putative tryptophan/tyrosine transport system substrate-binding protein